ncbi:MAG: hypothetical protein U9R50_00710 [Campylobacterota bacterium]|nr:hypothetical protein [Campylobacterota bacterium]
MNKINPLFLLGFFVLVAILMIYKSNVTQSKIMIVNQNNIQAEADGKKIQLLKQRWKDQKMMKKRIDTLLSHSAYANKVVKKEKKRNSYILKLEGLDYRSLDSFTNKILNETISIKKMTIERFSEHSASITVECAL